MYSDPQVYHSPPIAAVQVIRYSRVAQRTVTAPAPLTRTQQHDLAFWERQRKTNETRRCEKLSRSLESEAPTRGKVFYDRVARYALQNNLRWHAALSHFDTL